MKKRLLYVTPSFQSFVKADLQILEKHFQVRVNQYPWKNKQYAPLYFFLQFFAMIPATIWADLIVVNFGGYWAYWPTFFAKLLGKKSVVIIHGTDSAAIPEINYGSLRIPILKKICGAAYSKTDLILPVSDSLIETALTFDPKIRNQSQGIKILYPNLNPNFKVIYNGLDEEFWSISPDIQKEENSFLTVMSPSQLTLKGGDLIVELAKEFPTCKFYFAGVGPEDLEIEIPENVQFLGRLSPETLRETYQKAQFYFQLSSFEGFGCALAEAMLCDCIPIGSNTNHIPQIIGESGFILTKKDLTLAIDLVQNTLYIENKEFLAQAAREQIIQNFTLKKREKELISTLNTLL
ncbi:glycosyltransferase family 4 protein [Algoriphagus vanfongensis]|uniref:glycosyltransferase family 4 protein n=1 Tax=Algoriphagus vanfongensis TaxID=426371 RepID=UPI00040AF048|nr:glycosyltransferase family 4 protein [Algoriphagus vanfongensis]